jgi:hypothetical protein
MRQEHEARLRLEREAQATAAEAELQRRWAAVEVQTTSIALLAAASTERRENCDAGSAEQVGESGAVPEDCGREIQL